MSFDELSSNVISRGSCTACGDFSSELADISCGGVGLESWTYTVIRTSTITTLFYGTIKRNLLKIEPAENFQTSTKLLVKLSRVKRSRIDSFPRDYKRVKNI